MRWPRGKAIVWIDGGLHSNETVGSQQLMETIYQLVSRTDAETTRLLRDDIVLCVEANPDGQEMVANWYMREKNPLKRSLANLPRSTTNTWGTMTTVISICRICRKPAT